MNGYAVKRNEKVIAQVSRKISLAFIRGEVSKGANFR